MFIRNRWAEIEIAQEIMTTFEQASDQKVNVDNFVVYFTLNTIHDHRALLAGSSGMQVLGILSHIYGFLSWWVVIKCRTKWISAHKVGPSCSTFYIRLNPQVQVSNGITKAIGKTLSTNITIPYNTYLSYIFRKLTNDTHGDTPSPQINVLVMRPFTIPIIISMLPQGNG